MSGKQVTFAEFAKLAFDGAQMRVAGTVAEVRELGKKDNKADIWRRILKLEVQGLTLELVADDAIAHGEKFQPGERIIVDATMRAGMANKPDMYVVGVQRVAAA